MAYATVARRMGADALIEQSRSGNGAHVWICFAQPVAAQLARKVGTIILAAAMTEHPQISFDSYDRFFPNQDTMPKGGFGSPIALPLQWIPRRNGNTVFVDDSFTPHRDQWDVLWSVRLLSVSDSYDYVDINVPVCVSMFGKRMTMHKKMGYTLELPPEAPPDPKSQAEPK